MQDSNLIPVHIPIGEATTLVYVNPTKIYNNVSGKELINKYHIKQPKQKPKFISSIHWRKTDKEYYVNSENTILKGEASNVLALPFLKHHKITSYNLHLSATLPETIKIGESTYSPVLIIQCLEELTGKKLLSRKDNRPLKRNINTTITINVIAPQEQLGVLAIINCKKAYLIAPRIEEE